MVGGGKSTERLALREILECVLIKPMTISHRPCCWGCSSFRWSPVTAANDSEGQVSSLRRHVHEKESKGIYAYSFDAASSELSVAAETSNPSFLAIGLDVNECNRLFSTFETIC